MNNQALNLKELKRELDDVRQMIMKPVPNSTFDKLNKSLSQSVVCVKDYRNEFENTVDKAISKVDELAKIIEDKAEANGLSEFLDESKLSEKFEEITGKLNEFKAKLFETADDGIYKYEELTQELQKHIEELKELTALDVLSELIGEEGVEKFKEDLNSLKETGLELRDSIVDGLADVLEMIGITDEGVQQLVGSLNEVCEGFAEALMEGSSFEQAIEGLGKAMVKSAVQVMSSAADQMIALGTLALFAPVAAAAQGATKATLAKGLAMKGAAMALKSMVKYESGGVVPGNSYTGDRILARVNSGELIMNQSQQERALAQMERGDAAGGGITVNIINNTDATVSSNMNEAGQLEVFIENKVLTTMGSYKGQKIIQNSGRGI